MNEAAKQLIKQVEDSIQEQIEHLRSVKAAVDENRLDRACMAAAHLRRSGNRGAGFVEELIDATLPFRV